MYYGGMKFDVDPAQLKDHQSLGLPESQGTYKPGSSEQQPPSKLVSKWSPWVTTGIETVGAGVQTLQDIELMKLRAKLGMPGKVKQKPTERPLVPTIKDWQQKLPRRSLMWMVLGGIAVVGIGIWLIRKRRGGRHVLPK